MAGGCELRVRVWRNFQTAAWVLSFGLVVLMFAGCGGGSVPPDSLSLQAADATSQNVRLQVRLAAEAAVTSQSEAGTDFRLVRATLNRAEVSLQEVEAEVSPEAESSNLVFSGVPPGSYLVVVQGFDAQGELLAQSSAAIEVLSGQVSRVSLVLRGGQIEPPPPPPPPVLGFGYFVRQGATGSGLRPDDPAGSLEQVLELYDAEPRDFIFIFHAPEPLQVPGFTELPEGLNLIGEAAGLEFDGRAVDGDLLAQSSIPPGLPPEVVANFLVGNDSLLAGFACRAGAEGPVVDLRGKEQIALELMIVDGSGLGGEGAAVNFEGFRGLLEFSGVRFRDFATSQNSLSGSFEQGVSLLRLQGCEISGRFALEGQGTAEVNLDCQNSRFSGLVDVFLEEETAGNILFQESEFFAPPGLQERILVSLFGDTVDGRVHFVDNLFRNYSITTSGSEGAQEWVWTGNFFEVLDSTDAKLSLTFLGGNSAVVFHQNRLGPSDPIEVPIPIDMQLFVSGQAQAQMRVSENEFFGSFFAQVSLDGSLDLGVLENSEYQDPDTFGQFQLFLAAQSDAQRLCTLITGNTFTDLFLTAFGTGIFEVEANEVDVEDALNADNTIVLNLVVDPQVSAVLTPGACEFPAAAVAPIVFPF